MLDQLGNLHEAGQQLAEVSARAAKAETEAEFLRERVSDLRRQLADATTDEIPATPETSVEISGDQDGGERESLLAAAAGRARSAYTDLRERRRNRSR
jgi:hypothetical protein